jgi:hypothetical protein
MLTRRANRLNINANPNACVGEADPELVAQGSLNEGGDGVNATASLVNNSLPNPTQSKQSFTIDDLTEWYEATGAQGDPYFYRKSDLEMWVMGLFNSYKFKAGQSKGQKRRSFNEVWDATNGESIAIAYGFNEALKRQIYSLAYVKACAKNLRSDIPPLKTRIPINPPDGVVPASQIKSKPTPLGEVIKIERRPPAEPKAKRTPKAKIEEPEAVELDLG